MFPHTAELPQKAFSSPLLTTATQGEKEALNAQMDLFRRLIVAQIEAKLAQNVAHDSQKEKTADDVVIQNINEISG